MAHDNEIRVLFVGDKGVGKTSIIHYIVTDIFPKNVERTFKTTTLETKSKTKNIKTTLIDTSTDQNKVEETEA